MKIIITIFSPLIFLFSILFPKKKNLWLFGAWFGNQYADNSKYLFEYVNQNHKDINAIWVYKNKDLQNIIKQKNYKSVYAYSLKGLYLQLRAKVFVSSINSNDFIPFLITFRNYYVQLWHGSPIKNIGLDMYPKNSFQYLKNKLRFLTIDNYNLIISPSSIFDKIFQSAFFAKEQCFFRGVYPRNTELLNSSDNKMIKDSLGIQSKYFFMYLPTHRGEGKTFDKQTHPVVNIIPELIKYNDLLKEHDITILIKPHYYEKELFSSIESSSNIKTMFDLSGYDLYDCLAVSDGLISDYSSVVFDFEITGKPIIYFPFDLETYKQEDRNLYFDFDFVYDNTNNSKKVETSKELIYEIIKSTDSHVDYKFNTSIFNETISQNSNANLIRYIIQSIK